MLYALIHWRPWTPAPAARSIEVAALPQRVIRKA